MRKKLFDELSYTCSELVTKKYSTSFCLATKMLSPKIRPHIYNIYGFVRLADEIVDTFHSYDKEALLLQFEKEYYESKKQGISLNPIINSFIYTAKKYNITDDLLQSFLNSMKMDLHKKDYITEEDYKSYIHGSADVVGLMCLKVFVKGNDEMYEKLKIPAMRLGTALQKVNFLRDFKEDMEVLNRSYFPNVNIKEMTLQSKTAIIKDIEEDFSFAYRNGILKLPIEAKFGVFVAYRYYKRLLTKIKKAPLSEMMRTRIRISNTMKINLLARSYVKYKLYDL